MRTPLLFPPLPTSSPPFLLKEELKLEGKWLQCMQGAAKRPSTHPQHHHQCKNQRTQWYITTTLALPSSLAPSFVLCVSCELSGSQTHVHAWLADIRREPQTNPNAPSTPVTSTAHKSGLLKGSIACPSLCWELAEPPPSVLTHRCIHTCAEASLHPGCNTTECQTVRHELGQAWGRP